jgi:hypothetical protein
VSLAAGVDEPDALAGLLALTIIRGGLAMPVRRLATVCVALLVMLGVASVGSAGAASPALGCKSSCTVISDPTVFTILWQPSNWTNFPFNKMGYDVTQVQQFISNLNETPYSNILAQYTSTGQTQPNDQVHYGGSCTVTDSTNDPSNGGNLAGTSSYPIADDTLATKIGECIDTESQTLPQWSASNPGNIYLLLPPEGMYFHGPIGANLGTKTSFSDFCGYHWANSLVEPSDTVVYGVIASPAFSTCIPGSTYEADAIWLTDHELFEAITNTGGGGYSDQRPGATSTWEVADECGSPPGGGLTFGTGENVNLNGTTYFLPGMWSNIAAGSTGVGTCQWVNYEAQVNPVATGTLGNPYSATPDPANLGWYTGNVNVTWDIRPASHVIVSGCANQSITTDGSTTVSCTVQGQIPLLNTNEGPAFTSTAMIHRDATPPVISSTTVNNSPFLLGSSTPGSVNATDPTPGSGMPGGVNVGPCPLFSRATVGTFSVICSATDVAGNTATKSVSYKVETVTASLAKDGGFETPKKTAAKTTVTAPAKVGPWTVNGAVIIGRKAGWAPAAGAQSLDLAGVANSGISQTFTLPASGRYIVNFKYAGNPTCGATTKKMLVTTTGADQNANLTETFSTTGHTITSMGWTAGSTTFGGRTGESVTLNFTDQTGTACGMTLDAVAVKGD